MDFKTNRRINTGKLYAGKMSTSVDLSKNFAFRHWFGDSKVVDELGSPLVVYHGTSEMFTTFTISRGGYYFTDDKLAAQAYADYSESESMAARPRLVDVYLALKNPLVLTKEWYAENVLDEDGEQNWEAVEFMIDEAHKTGYDGLILRGFPDFDGMEYRPGAKVGVRKQREYDQYVAFFPNQIKSASSNSGQFDPDDPDITR